MGTTRSNKPSCKKRHGDRTRRQPPTRQARWSGWDGNPENGVSYTCENTRAGAGTGVAVEFVRGGRMLVRGFFGGHEACVLFDRGTGGRPFRCPFRRDGPSHLRTQKISAGAKPNHGFFGCQQSGAKFFAAAAAAARRPPVRLLRPARTAQARNTRSREMRGEGKKLFYRPFLVRASPQRDRREACAHVAGTNRRRSKRNKPRLKKFPRENPDFAPRTLRRTRTAQTFRLRGMPAKALPARDEDADGDNERPPEAIVDASTATRATDTRRGPRTRKTRAVADAGSRSGERAGRISDPLPPAVRRSRRAPAVR